MLYTVNFGRRPIDYFLSSEDPFDYAQGRAVIHDDTQWSGPEPAPLSQIRRADQLHYVLYVIQDAAAEWYPDDVAMVFRTVHGDAVNNVPHAAPQVINTMCNLYQAAFGELFDDILHHVPSRDLNSRAHRVLRRDSSAYQQYVARVLNDAVVHTVLQGPPSEPREAQRQAHSRSWSRRQPR
ncbi:hypothetical protein V7S43_005600 [Phytophthora oleae]|uniref:Helitron helicase-like domain-containing protein n=1 Tax=Phytophthora oleae TaxID=2107226 RepID=A0ABD3FTD9_9STRA